MAKRRSNNEGTICQLPSGNWRAQIYINGHRIGKTKKSKKEAQLWLRNTLDKTINGYTGIGSNTLFQDYLDEWLEIKQSTVREKTWGLYESTIRIHIRPYLGKIRLKDLEPKQIQGLYLAKEQNGTGARTINVMHSIICNSLKNAVRLGQLQNNPARVVSPPKYTSPEMDIYSEHEIRQLLLAVKGTSLDALILLALTTGMRQSEILALKWSDVDWDRNTTSIQRQLRRKCKKPNYFSSPKTKSSIRTISLGVNTMEKLLEHHKNQKEKIGQNSQRWEENDLIFPTAVGTPIRQRNLHRKFKSTLESSGLREIRFHDLRHTAASLMLNNGISPLIVAKRLGHSKVSITLDTYGHVLPGMQQESANLIDKLINPIPVELHTNCTQSQEIQKIS